MNAVIETAAPRPAQGGWEPREVPGLVADQLNRWKAITARLRAYAEKNGLSRTEVSQRSDVPMGTLSPWFDGKYTGNYESVGERIVKWLDAEQDRGTRLIEVFEAPDYIETPTSRDVWDTLMWAQQKPGMVAITLAAGMGKTTTCNQYVAMVPATHLVTMRRTTATAMGMLREIARVLNVTERSTHLLDSAIGERLRRANGRKTLLIIDEAQNLGDEAVDQLRWFLDYHKCGLALVGNMDVQTRYGGGVTPREGYGQIHRRISKRLLRLKPKPQDITTLIDAWGVEDESARKLLAAIGTKPGTLGQIDETLKLAKLLAAGSGSAAVTSDHVRQAWINRGNEEMR